MSSANSSNPATPSPYATANPDAAPSPYADIIHLSRPIIKNHKPMTRAARAAQFSPYAALVGHKEIIQDVEDHSTYLESEIIPESQD